MFIDQADLDWSKILVSGNRMFIGSNAAAPNALMKNLIENAQGLTDVELVHILTLQAPEWAQPQHRNMFTINSLFLGSGVRDEVAAGYADYTPCFLSEIPSLFKEGILALDVALIMVSPPDDFGYCSFGVSVDVVKAAAEAARIVVAQINPQMPVTSGQAFIHIDEIDHCILIDEPIVELQSPELDPVTEQIGQYVSLLIEDGDTLQLGIGKIPDAVLCYLNDHKDLGIHTEMFSDSLIDLVASGVVNNRKKTFHNGKIISSFCMGSKKLYDFVDHNPHIEFHPSEYVNSPVNIARNDNMVSINSAIEVDLSGQVVSDSIGYRFYSGIGGQVDFIRGASMSKGGRPIIALPSTAKNGTVSKITAFITEGSGVVTSRGDVHYVVTEYGIATLRGKSIRQRALELIKIAHPKFREQLLAQVRKHMRVPHYQLQSPCRVPELGDIEDKILRLDNQKFILRPLAPSDERHLQEFFYSHKKETLLMRYNYRPTRMSRETSSSLVAVDQSTDVALCITNNIGPGEKIQAVGRYYYVAQGNCAEVAFVVREEQQGKGMAKTLLRWLISIARERNLDAVIAYTRKDNRPMQNIFSAFDFKKIQQDQDEVYFELKLKPQ
ncbi:MAG: acetyl-CoA hydrolase [Osedax symbiont Rs2]|nr:MAG: acetyl-CoA hydrolase [Osedax symbiont Rs2]